MSTKNKQTVEPLFVSNINKFYKNKFILKFYNEYSGLKSKNKIENYNENDEVAICFYEVFEFESVQPCNYLRHKHGICDLTQYVDNMIIDCDNLLKNKRCPIKRRSSIKVISHQPINVFYKFKKIKNIEVVRVDYRTKDVEVEFTFYDDN